MSVPGRRGPPVPRGKIARPGLQERYVPRPRLIEHLARAGDGQVVLVCAPAGYGKTLMLAEWTSTMTERCAWVTVDEDDNVDGRLWSAILAAVAACGVVPPDSRVRTLAVPVRAGRDSTFLAAVVDALDLLPSPITLVLDDVQDLTDGDTLHGLAALLRDRPARLQVVLSTRRDPPLRLDRLRPTGELFEIRAPDLAFSASEAASLLHAADLVVRPDQLRLLLEQTEGWAAGLRMAALSLHGSADPDGFLADLVGNERALSDYLFDEVLSGLSTDVLDVLGAVSVCDQVNAPLAVAVAARDDAGEVLARAERDTSLVLSYGHGREWFRVHPLLRAHLQADLRRLRPGHTAALHARAARWYAGAGGDARTALQHAHQADDPILLARLLRQDGPTLAVSGNHAAVVAAVDRIPAEWVEGDALLALVGALGHLELGHESRAQRLLDAADRSWPAQPTAALQTLRETALVRHSLYTPASPPRPAADPPSGPEIDGELGTVGLLLHATALMNSGRLEESAAWARAGTAGARREANPFLEARALIVEAMIAAQEGRVRDMVTMSEHADRTAPADLWHGTINHAYTTLLRAYGALMQSRPQQALLIGAGLGAPEAGGQGRPDIEAVLPALDVIRGAARFDLGEHLAGLDAMRAQRVRLAGGDPPTLAMTALLEHDAATRLGLRSHAREVLEWAEQMLGPTGDVLLLRARGPAGIHRYDVARHHLAPLLNGAATPVARWSLIEGHMLVCEMTLAAGDRGAARIALEHALALAEGSGVLRPVVAAGEVTAELMAATGHGTAHGALVAEVLQLREARGHHLPVSPLTAQERAVLSLLPTMLSLDEIGDTLTVTISTVKSHVQSVYRKLDVSSRREAVDEAARQGLIVVPDGGHRR